jgi:hypothetical protein
MPPPRMCAQESDCGAQASCVAGRCVAHGATPAVDSGRRLLFAPVDVGYVCRHEAIRDPALATFGRAGQPSVAFLRFSVPLPPEATVLEAYVLLQRATSVDADAVPVATVPMAVSISVPISLHAAQVVSAWDGRTLSWATQPRIAEVGGPVTRISPAAGSLVRLDVRDTVQRWRKRGRDELGLAILSQGESVTGVTFALTPVDGARDRDDPVLTPQSAAPQPASPFESRAASWGAGGDVGDPSRPLEGPRLEVYVK